MSAESAAEPIDWIDPLALFCAGPARASHSFWLDAGPDAHTGWSWMGVGEPASGLPREVVLHGAGRTGRVPGGFGGGWVGWAGYDDAAAAAGAPATPDDTASHSAALVVRHLIAFDHAAQRAWLIAPGAEIADARGQLERWRARAAAGVVAPAASTRDTHTPARRAAARHSPDDYAALIEHCRTAIRAGDAYQLCLTTRFSLTAPADDPIDPVGVYVRLRRAQSAPHGAYIRVGDHALVSASPEQFLRVTDGVVRTRPIKGTRPRSADPVADTALARELAASVKERAENVMIVDLMRNDVQRVCLPGTVAAERLLEIESYPAVHQLVSTVAGRLRPGATLGDLLHATFPAGSMTGAPKRSAMTILHALEGDARGIYAGCFGWVGTDGGVDLAMTIRSIVVHPGGAYVGAGGGITWLSDPAGEVAEVALKARGPLAALGALLPEDWQAAESTAMTVR